MLDKRVRYFMKVVEEGSFSAAARMLFLSQSALSQQITALEEEMNVVLFDRSGYKPVLTLKGHAFYDGCLDIVQLENEIQKRISLIGENTIRIGFNGASANRLLLDAVKYTNKVLPGIDIAFKKGTPEELVIFLENEKLDLSFGLESDYRHVPEISYVPLLNYEMSLLCSKEYPIDATKPIELSDISDHPFEFLSVSFGKNYFKEFKDSYKADGVKLNIVKYADNYDELLFDLIMGNVLTISSKYVMRDKDIISIPLKQTHHTNRYVVAWKDTKGEHPYPEFIACLQDYFQTL